jgi:glycosyltransferase involved in cell wall biosynthesis
MKNYRIAIVAPPWYPVPPSGYGGIELVVDLLMQGLKKRDIDVVLYARDGSGHDAVTLAPAEWSVDLAKFNHPFREATYLGRVVDHLKSAGADLVHDHSWGMSAPLILSMTGMPTLHTVHGPVNEVAETLYRSVGCTEVGLISISDAQRSPARDLNWVGTVHNAVDIDALQFADVSEKDDYLLCLARISPEKGQHIAIEVARRTGRRLILAGKVGERPEEQSYYEREVAPHLDGDKVVHFGNVAGKEKASLLAKAYALVSPVQWPEPFGLAMVEAMVSGTPVVAIGLGATVELIEQGKTGLVVKDADSMVTAVSLVGDIDARACAARARDAFSPQKMADKYIALYERALNVGEDDLKSPRLKVVRAAS